MSRTRTASPRTARAATATPRTATPGPGRAVRRASWHPGRRWLLAGAVVAAIGSFLPWLELAFGASFNGLQGAGLWTFYLSWLGLAGAMVPVRSAAIVQGLLAGGAAVGLPLIQVVEVTRLGLPGWQPGIGLLLTVCGGVLMLRGTVSLLRRTGAAA